MKQTDVFVHPAGLSNLAGPVVVGLLHESFTYHVCGVKEIESFPSIQECTSWMLNQLLLEVVHKGFTKMTLVSDHLFVGIKYDVLQKRKPDPKAKKIKSLTDKALQVHLQSLDNRFPQYDLLGSGNNHIFDYYMNVLKHGYNETIHRKSTLHDLPAWMYLNQELLEKHLYLPAWWKRLFSEESSTITAREMINPSLKEARKKIVLSRKPHRNL